MNKENWETLFRLKQNDWIEACKDLEAAIEERDAAISRTEEAQAAMRETGDMVRSLYTAKLEQAIRERDEARAECEKLRVATPTMNALAAAIKERDEFKAAADIINAANDRLEDLLHKMTEERDSAEAGAVEAALLLAISNKKRDEARANLDKALQYDGETAERVRSAKLVEALKRWFKATESNRNNDAPAFYEIWAKECLDSLRALEEALAEYSKGES